jgi:GNAT superfamily N-acetyltransferase
MALAASLGLFAPDELEALEQMLVEALEASGDTLPFWITDDEAGKLVGLVYCEPERMTEGTWTLQLIAVHPTHQKQGRGANLLLAVEQALAARGARIWAHRSLSMCDRFIEKMDLTKRLAFASSTPKVWIRWFFGRLWRIKL